jgi:hypothetical protein
MVTTRKRSSKVPEPTAEDEAKNTKSIQERRSTDDESEQEDKNDETKEGEAEISEEQIQHAIALASAAASKKFGWDKITNQQSSSSNSNPLSEIIPGYVAPLSLDSSSLDKYKTSSQRNVLGNSSSSKSSKSPSFCTIHHRKPSRKPNRILQTLQKAKRTLDQDGSTLKQPPTRPKYRLTLQSSEIVIFSIPRNFTNRRTLVRRDLTRRWSNWVRWWRVPWNLSSRID